MENKNDKKEEAGSDTLWTALERGASRDALGFLITRGADVTSSPEYQNHPMITEALRWVINQDNAIEFPARFSEFDF